MRIVNRTYIVDNNLNKKIVLLSDIHYFNRKDIINLNKVLDKVKLLNPDYICIAGDTMDRYEVESFELLLEWLTKLANISKVIMVLGNHEFYLDRKNDKYKLNNSYIKQIKKINNLYFLDNENKVIDNINFIGLTLPIDYYMVYSEDENMFKKHIKNIKVEKGLYNILLCHSPINIVKKEILKDIDVDLILCGHMHGGLTPNILKPFMNRRGLISPKRDLFPKDAYGHIKRCNKDIIISSGIKVMSQSHLKFIKNCFASEIVEIIIE